MRLLLLLPLLLLLLPLPVCGLRPMYPTSRSRPGKSCSSLFLSFAQTQRGLRWCVHLLRTPDDSGDAARWLRIRAELPQSETDRILLPSPPPRRGMRLLNSLGGRPPEEPHNSRERPKTTVLELSKCTAVHTPSLTSRSKWDGPLSHRTSRLVGWWGLSLYLGAFALLPAIYESERFEIGCLSLHPICFFCKGGGQKQNNKHTH